MDRYLINISWQALAVNVQMLGSRSLIKTCVEITCISDTCATQALHMNKLYGYDRMMML